MMLSGRARYRQIRWFFLKVTLHLVWWDIVLNRPILRLWRRPPVPRWQQLTRDYRQMAQELGGVLIKLGQFLSTRVDILPAVVTDELVGLQDAVPPVPLEAVAVQIEEDFKRPLADLFPWFSPEPLGSASLAQAHRAQLASGEIVVVRALRPGIAALVEADLQGIVQAIQRLKLYKRVRRVVDLDRLVNEFVTVTQREIGMQAEGRHAERFAREFAQSPQIAVPKIYWAYSASRTLTMEDVAYLRIDDLEAIAATGINRTDVAKVLFHAYMEQFFITYFVHSDPHAGNLFVKPLPDDDERHQFGADWVGFRPGEHVPCRPARPFQLVFIDFGMVVSISEWLREPMQEYMIGVGTGDAQRIVNAYVAMGVVEPSTDLDRLKSLTESTLAQFRTTLVGQFHHVDLDAFNKLFLQQYQDVTSRGALQFQAELLFVTRACGILSGMLAHIDADFDTEAETIQFTNRLQQNQHQDDLNDLLAESLNPLPQLIKIRNQVMEMLDQVLKGKLTIQAHFSRDIRKTSEQLQQSVNRLTWILAGVGVMLSGAVWHVGMRLEAAIHRAAPSHDVLGIGLMVLAVILFLLGVIRRK